MFISGLSGIPGIMCSPPKCEGRCRVDYNAKPCPNCVCDGSTTPGEK